MSSHHEQIEKVYNVASMAEQEVAYDDWSARYERDVFAMGYRAPAMAAAVFARFVAPDVSPILDAGCGGGLQGEPLAVLGYGPIVGIDLSEGMLSVAREKRIYESLHKMAMGDGLDFPKDSFGAVISVGTITPGHAPASSFADLAHVARPGARVVISLRCDPGIGPEYWEACRALEENGTWRHLFTSGPYTAMPNTEPDIICRAHVFEVT